MESLLSENGLLYILGYTKKQLGMNTGGPKKVEMLYPEDLEDQIPLKLINKNIFSDNVYEGTFHQGKSHLIELLFKNEV